MQEDGQEDLPWITHAQGRRSVHLIAEISEAMVAQLELDSGLETYRQAYRGDSTSGLTEWIPAMPVFQNGRFEIQDADAPYLAVTRAGSAFVEGEKEPFNSDLFLKRRVIGILSDNLRTYERDEELKGFYLATWRAIFGDAMDAALRAIGVRQIRGLETDVEGLLGIDHAAFIIDLDLRLDGGALMR